MQTLQIPQEKYTSLVFETFTPLTCTHYDRRNKKSVNRMIESK